MSLDPRYQRLCQLLIDARLRAKKTQAQVAECLHRPQSFVSKYESGGRRLDVVEFLQVADCLGVSGPDLLGVLTASLLELREPSPD